MATNDPDEMVRRRPVPPGDPLDGPPGTAAASQSDASSKTRSPTAYAWFVLGLMTVALTMNYVDRQTIAILQIPIKRELLLSDTQLGFLTGSAFGLIYAFMAMPISALADRVSRKAVLCVSLLAWSGMTCATSLAHSYPTLILLRMGLAVSEAGFFPAALSLMSDYFPRARRATAVGVLGLAFPFGIGAGFVVGGLATTLGSWRIVFLDVGLVTLVMVPLLFLLVREPVRGAQDGVISTKAPSMPRALAELFSSSVLRNAIFATALVSFPLYGLMAWSAPFFHRVFHEDLARLGVTLALVYSLAGGLGIFLGGYLADQLERFDPRWRLRVPALMALVSAPAIAVQCFAPNAGLSLVGTGVSILALNACFPAITALVQSSVASNMRAFSGSVLALTIVLSGLGLGPLVIGSLSDAAAAGLGPERALRLALGVSLIPALWSVFHFARAAGRLGR